MPGGSDNRTEKPTPRRLQKAREKGQIARSKEIPSALVLLGGLFFLFYAGEEIFNALQFQMRDLLRLKPPPELSVTYVSGIINRVTVRMAMVVGPLMLIALTLGLTANFLQGGLTVSWQALRFHFDKLNPKNGLSKIFSKNGLVELLKGLTLLVIVSIISYQVVSHYLPVYPRLVLMDVRQLLHWTTTISYQVLLRVGIFLLLLSLVDYAFQKYRFLENLKMTKQEVKQDFKDTEGDPLTRGRIRRIQREMARKRMMADVPKAEVVITNPTHYAVALAYEMESMEAPQVVAKGVGFLAIKIKELAQENNVPLVENKPLAQALYKTVEVGHFVPAHLYRAVAEILAYIYRARTEWQRSANSGRSAQN